MNSLNDKKPLVDGYFIGFPVIVAVELGINEAIFLSRLHYWLQRSNNEKDGFIWVYKTFEEWKEEFPFWSDSTIKRLKKDLEKRNFLIVANYNKMKMDRTLWYRIDYERLNDALGQNDTMDSVKMTQSLGQNDTMDSVKMTQPITKDYTKNTKNTRKRAKRIYEADSDEMVLVNFFISEIRKNDPKFKEPNKQTWADEFRKLIELDQRDKSEISKLIRWVQQDAFWKSNILSPRKLKEKYSALVIKMNDEHSNEPPSEYIPPKVLTIKADTGPNYD